MPCQHPHNFQHGSRAETLHAAGPAFRHLFHGLRRYALLTGCPPFPDRTLAELVERNPAVGPAPIAHLVDAPVLLAEVLASTLSPDPNRRPQTALQLAAALDRLADFVAGGDQYQPRGPTSTASHVVAAMPSAPTAPAPSPLAISGGNQLGGRSVADQSPTGMLDNYIGPGRYRPVAARERSSVWFWMWVGLSAAAVLGLTMWVTVHFLTR